jgi:hypothetical protein
LVKERERCEDNSTGLVKERERCKDNSTGLVKERERCKDNSTGLVLILKYFSLFLSRPDEPLYRRLVWSLSLAVTHLVHEVRFTSIFFDGTQCLFSTPIWKKSFIVSLQL